MSKHLHAGHAAASGLRAALLAARGFTGPARILEGEQGFFRALCPDARPEAVMADAPGWRLPETSIKPWPCCRHTHPAIDAALELRRDLLKAGHDPASAAEVQVETYSAAQRITDAPHPATPWEARFSLQFCVAAALLHGSPGMATFEEQLHDPSIRSLMGRVSLRHDPELEAAYPARWGGEVRVRIAGDDGAARGRRTPAATGDPERPLRDELLDAKVRDLFRWGGLEAEAGEGLLGECRRMAEGGGAPRIPWPEG